MRSCSRRILVPSELLRRAVKSSCSGPVRFFNSSTKRFSPGSTTQNNHLIPACSQETSCPSSRRLSSHAPLLFSFIKFSSQNCKKQDPYSLCLIRTVVTNKLNLFVPGLPRSSQEPVKWVRKFLPALFPLTKPLRLKRYFSKTSSLSVPMS